MQHQMAAPRQSTRQHSTAVAAHTVAVPVAHQQPPVHDAAVARVDVGRDHDTHASSTTATRAPHSAAQDAELVANPLFAGDADASSVGAVATATALAAAEAIDIVPSEPVAATAPVDVNTPTSGNKTQALLQKLKSLKR